MKNLNGQSVALVLLGVAVVALLARDNATASGRDGADSNSQMIAVTGEFGNGTSVLYVIDTAEKQLAVYKTLSGNKVEFVAARDIEFDLKMKSYNDRTDPDLDPQIMKDRYLQFTKKKRTAVGSSSEEPKKD